MGRLFEDEAAGVHQQERDMGLGTPAVEEELRAWAAERRRRRRRWLVSLAVAAGALILWQGATSLPAWMIERAGERSTECLHRVDESGRGDPAACAKSARWLLVPRLVPWRRGDALAAEADLRYRVTRKVLAVASRRDLDLEAKKLAASTLVENYAGKHYRYTGDALQQAGALEAMAEFGELAGTSYERHSAMRAAIILGDWERAAAVASLPPLEEHHWDDLLADGLVLCIAGDRAAGRKLLRDADELYRQRTDGSRAYAEARAAALACGASAEELLAEAPVRSEHPLLNVAMTVFGGADAPAMRADDISLSRGTPRALAVAQRIVRAGDSLPAPWELERLLRLIAPDTGSLLRPPAQVTRWHLAADGRGAIQAPEMLAEAAQKLATWAGLAPRETAPPHASVAGLMGWSEARNTAPAATLRWGALALEAHAAAQWAWRGDVAPARAALGRARKLIDAGGFGPFDGFARHFILLGVVHSVHGAEAACKVAGALEDQEWESLDKSAGPLMRAQLATIEAEGGDLAKAMAHVERAREMLEHPSGEQLELDPYVDAISWLEAALAFRAGAEDALRPPAPPRDLRSASASNVEIVAYWVHAARARESERGRVRWMSRAKLHDAPYARDVSYRPLIFDLVGRAAGEAETELWLDAVTGRKQRDPLTYVRVRLAAARLRGDSEAASTWKGREDAITARLAGNRAATLYRLLPWAP